jgi:hypothetical protein
MPQITDIKRLKNRLEQLTNKYTSTTETPTVVVGYTANYAVHVHERPAKHKPGKQMKFLEQPARQLGDTLGGMVAEALKRGVKLLPALYLAGQRLQRESQDIVPVELGNLKGSAFTAKEDELMSVVAASEGKLMERMQKQFERKVAKKEKQAKQLKARMMKKALKTKLKPKKKTRKKRK